MILEMCFQQCRLYPAQTGKVGQSSAVTLFSCLAMCPCQACCMTQNQLVIYNNVSDPNKAEFGVLIDGILQEGNLTFSPAGLQWPVWTC